MGGLSIKRGRNLGLFKALVLTAKGMGGGTAIAYPAPSTIRLLRRAVVRGIIGAVNVR